MALKPPELKPMYYENAAIYTNSLLDAYMDYKNVRLSFYEKSLFTVS